MPNRKEKTQYERRSKNPGKGKETLGLYLFLHNPYFFYKPRTINTVDGHRTIIFYSVLLIRQIYLGSVQIEREKTQAE